MAGKAGNDLICASASALVSTLAQNITWLEKAGVAKNAKIILERGEALVACEAVGEEETLLCVYDTVVTGFAMLAHNYPKHVKFSEK